MKIRASPRRPSRKSCRPDAGVATGQESTSRRVGSMGSPPLGGPPRLAGRRAPRGGGAENRGGGPHDRPAGRAGGGAGSGGGGGGGGGGRGGPPAGGVPPPAPPRGPRRSRAYALSDNRRMLDL